MSGADSSEPGGPEPTVRDRLAEPVQLDPSRVRDLAPRDILIRFAAGAVTSIAAGLLTLALGPRVGGAMLAFPAILAASLTLIQEEDDAVEAREDSRGAIVGGAALAAFAGTAALALGSVAAPVVLLLATAAWAAVALGGYLLLWWRKS